mmetsp:Transcript_577/g.1034  ORF Transcript_577/g.1034 Transcript_577/m.1034 type:complete len:284 (-) Transcript_577:33-884(-)|eukprot:CAMPEP_0182454220 /NCGR_PEP_ID=MMETSP1319-20130603/950_1 /TAXON_ID=172717 /ORGANISM="Bolidomonas pacifica, Strain RCC208" /LENGTH=283 /DNA_ID=CAMNT_0024652217 /DNA_START=213 /DNA_END=1064 /DNA_ORIENTATION=-
MANRKGRKGRKVHSEVTLRILKDHGYAVGDEWVDLSSILASQDSLTTTYLPSDPLPNQNRTESHNDEHSTDFVTNSTDTLAAAVSLLENCTSVAALNFASAKHAGGGWLSGAQAQEESITRRSTLYASLSCDSARPYYEHNMSNLKPVNNGLYTDAIILSSSVAILQPDETDPFGYLTSPPTCAFLTCPAPNANHALRMNESLASIESVFRARIDRVLAVAKAHNIEGLVLGAWGCGVFGNDPHFVANTMMSLLKGKYRGVFKAVSFPLRDDVNREAFEEVVK